MDSCLNMELTTDECELFYDLDNEEELELLQCDSDGVCLMNFETCPYYTPVWDWEEDD